MKKLYQDKYKNIYTYFGWVWILIHVYLYLYIEILMFRLHPKRLPEYLDGRICVQEKTGKRNGGIPNGFTHLELQTTHNVLQPN